MTTYEIRLSDYHGARVVSKHHTLTAIARDIIAGRAVCARDCQCLGSIVVEFQGGRAVSVTCAQEPWYTRGGSRDERIDALASELERELRQGPVADTWNAIALAALR